MGSGSSSNVKPITTTSQKQPEAVTTPGGDGGRKGGDRRDEKHRETSGPSNTVIQVMTSSIPIANTEEVTIKNDSEESEDLTNSLNTAELEKDRDKLREQVTDLQKQVSDFESQNLDLTEQIQILEEQLEKHHADNVAKSTDQCVNTVAAKDQYIQKLEKETKKIQDEVSKLKLKYKKKIRSMSSQINEAKHESSLRAFEMKDEVQRLKEENAELIDKIKLASSKNFAVDYNRDSSNMQGESASNRTSLVLELSSRVSEQEGKITELELKLKERDKIIEELKIKSRTGSSKGKRSGSAKSQTSVSSFGAALNQDQDEWSIAGPSRPNKEEILFDNRPPVGHDSNLNDYGIDPRKKTKKKNCLRERARASRSEAVVPNFADARESSGTSRDSGFESVHGENKKTVPSGHWLKIRPENKNQMEVNVDSDDGLELESFQGTTPGPSSSNTGRPVSPVSEGSRWSDEEPGNEQDLSDIKSHISQSSIRRISAPKKKKKHAIPDHDLLMDNLLKDLDAPLDVASVSRFNGTETLTRPKVVV